MVSTTNQILVLTFACVVGIAGATFVASAAEPTVC
jgi:beta-lactamase regulating signal transducer with metallopeptidase domain